MRPHSLSLLSQNHHSLQLFILIAWLAIVSDLLDASTAAVAAEPLWQQVCSTASEYPFCDRSLEIHARIDDYVARVPRHEKIRRMTHHAPAYKPLQIPAYQWWSEGVHGAMEPCVSDELNDSNTSSPTCRCPTSFPCPSALGNAFSRSLYHEIGEAIGKEARAIASFRKHDTKVGDGLTYWSPNINLQRDPRWGRNQEGKSEEAALLVGKGQTSHNVQFQAKIHT